MTNEASSMGCLYYLISHHVLRTTYTLCSEIMGVREKVSTELWEGEMEGDREKRREGEISDTFSPVGQVGR